VRLPGARTAVKVVVTVGLLGWFLHQFGTGQALDSLRQARSTDLLAMFALSIAMILTIALRWHLLLRAVHGPRLGFGEVSEATFVGYYAGYFLPSVGGDAVRVSCLAGPGRRPVLLAVSALVDRSVGLVALLALGVGAVFLHGAAGDRRWMLWLVYLSAAATVAATLALCHVTGPAARWLELPTGGPARRLAPLLRSVGAAVDLYAARKAVLVQALGLALVSQLLSVAIYYGAARALGVGDRLLDFLYGVPVVNLAIVLPISIGGIGVGEWTFVYIFTGLGMPGDAAFSVSLLNLVARLAAGLVGAAFYAVARR
jgi:uncharacterized protein (TIRG00374 family)